MFNLDLNHLKKLLLISKSIFYGLVVLTIGINVNPPIDMLKGNSRVSFQFNGTMLFSIIVFYSGILMIKNRIERLEDMIIDNNIENEDIEDLELQNNVALEPRTTDLQVRYNLKILKESFNHLTENSLKQLQKSLYIDNFPEKMKRQIIKTDTLTSRQIIGNRLSLLYMSREFRSSYLRYIRFNTSYEDINQEFLNKVFNCIIPNIFGLEVDVEKNIEDNFDLHSEKIMSIFCQDLLEHLDNLSSKAQKELTRKNLLDLYTKALKTYSDHIKEEASNIETVNTVAINIFTKSKSNNCILTNSCIDQEKNNYQLNDINRSQRYVEKLLRSKSI